jgi:soluble lytic murein transglycosylase
MAFGLPAAAQAMPEADAAISVAREAFRTGDRVRLLAAREQLLQAGHPLAPWADYWAVVQRLSQATPDEVDAFLARWPDSYVADRARNDWLLELGRRQDWQTFLRIQPAFRMNDDREVTCLGWLARYETRAVSDTQGDWRGQARDAWLAQRDADAGCDALARRMVAAGVFTQDDVWRKLRLMVETNRPRGIEQTARLLGGSAPTVVARLMDAPQAFLMAGGGTAAAGGAGGGARTPGAAVGPAPERGTPRQQAKRRAAPPPVPEVQPAWRGPMSLLAFIRWATSDPAAAAQAMQDPAARQRWQWRSEEAAWAWAHLGRHSAWRFLPEAPAHFERALTDLALAVSTGEWRPQGGHAAAAWSTDTLQWMARAGLRSAVTGEPARWALVEQAIDAMPESLQRDGAWMYWKARAMLARAPAGPGGEAQRAQARALLARTVDPFSFYGQLAHETLHRRPHPPVAAAAPLTELERSWAASHPGVDRALRLFALGWRIEAVREWNFTIGHARPGGFNDRELLAVADAACTRAIWDRCINTSDRTRAEFDLNQRYPTPFRADVLRAARDVGLDPAYMFGLIRQESRFMPTARSQVGASGLMQVMPATATWTARKLGIPYTPDRITDPDTNLRLGAGYLKLVLDDFQGAQALAAAAYNAGPGRPRRWREGPTMEAAAWVENVPFTETRDYVKKVLANAVVYGQLLHGHSLSITNRLGPTIGPRATTAPAESRDLP